jgi:hypothetical protein
VEEKLSEKTCGTTCRHFYDGHCWAANHYAAHVCGGYPEPTEDICPAYDDGSFKTAVRELVDDLDLVYLRKSIRDKISAVEKFLKEKR